MTMMLEIMFVLTLVLAAGLVSRRNGNGKLKAQLVARLESCNTQILLQNEILAQHIVARGPDRRAPTIPLAESKTA